MSESIQILLVDDEPDFLEPLGFWLVSKGYRVSKVRDGEKAIELIRAGRQDVVFLDLVMPGMDGIETLRRIRTFDKRTPVILVTAATKDENALAGAHALGVSGVFPKGGSLAELTDILQVALRMLPKVQAGASRSPAGSPPTPPAGIAGWLRALWARLTSATR